MAKIVDDHRKLQNESLETRATETGRPVDDESDPRNWLALFGDQMFRYAKTRVGDGGVAEDIVQEALLGGIKSHQSFDARSSVKTWLFAILRNKLKDYFAKKRCNTSKFDSTHPSEGGLDLASLLQPEMESNDFQSAAEREEFWTAMDECARSMPTHFEEVFRMRLANEDSPVEVLSENLGISQSNFNVRLFRARLLMRKCLEKLWLGKK